MSGDVSEMVAHVQCWRHQYLRCWRAVVQHSLCGLPVWPCEVELDRSWSWRSVTHRGQWELEPLEVYHYEQHSAVLSDCPGTHIHIIRQSSYSHHSLDCVMYCNPSVRLSVCLSVTSTLVTQTKTLRLTGSEQKQNCRAAKLNLNNAKELKCAKITRCFHDRRLNDWWSCDRGRQETAVMIRALGGAQPPSDATAMGWKRNCVPMSVKRLKIKPLKVKCEAREVLTDKHRKWRWYGVCDQGDTTRLCVVWTWRLFYLYNELFIIG